MAFSIEKTEDFIEVHVWGEAQPGEVMAILHKLREMAPRKETSDLWVFPEEYVVPWDAFVTIVKEITGFVVPGMVGKKTAIVVANNFQMAQGELYRKEAKALPFEIGVFMSRDEAMEWLKT